MAYLFGHFILKIVGIRSLDIPGHAAVEDTGHTCSQPYVSLSEHSEEYNEEEYEIPDYTLIFDPEDTFKNGPEDDININTITTLTNISLAPRCILD